MTDKEKQQIFDLIKQAKEGQQRAFTMLYERFKDVIYHTLLKIVNNNDVADDLLSVTFCKAFMKIESYVSDISFEMWLKTIAVNSAIDFIRRTKKEKNNYYVEDSEGKFQFSDSADCSPEDICIFEETNSKLQEAFAKLRFKYKNILQLRTEQNLSYREISEQLGLSESQVKSTLNKAREKLKELLN